MIELHTSDERRPDFTHFAALLKREVVEKGLNSLKVTP
jgi:hypothetical protein